MRGHAGDDNPKTIPKFAYDCFAVRPAEIQAIAHGTAPTHINRIHNMPLDIIPAIDHNPSKPPGAPALFLSKTCDRTTPGGCQNATNFAFHWVVDTFTWNGATGTGTYNIGGEQEIKTERLNSRIISNAGEALLSDIERALLSRFDI